MAKILETTKDWIVFIIMLFSLFASAFCMMLDLKEENGEINLTVFIIIKVAGVLLGALGAYIYKVTIINKETEE